MSFDTDVLVIGAGPVGLVNAWGMKHLNPNLNIIVLEKYAQYQRTHTLVIQAAQLEAIMEATHSKQEPTLVALLKKLKQEPHIRTNVLQQIFTKLCQKNGIIIKTEQAVQTETLNQIISDEYPNVSLIIGADGTHSVVSKALFSEDNQVKHEFDFALQLRFEINGEEKAPGIEIQKFYQHMARKGLVANEYVGHFDQGKTPVTMQMPISKEDFLILQKATSKNPLKLYAAEEVPQDAPTLPPHLKAFLAGYLNNKIKDTTHVGQFIDKESVRISVNETPATHAKQIVNKKGHARVVLAGDSALGLSYFKGLNAGFEASAKFLTSMSLAIEDSFKNKELMDKQLDKYQHWFLTIFSPQKVKEVGQYSFWRLRSLIKAARAIQSFKIMTVPDENDALYPEIANYFKYFIKDPLDKKSIKWRAFPHREYDLVKLGQFDDVPLKHTAKKIIKIFVDYFKPYKSKNQLIQDFKQPLVGMINFFIGFGKTLAGIFTINFKLIPDGLFNMLRGIIELITTPLTWLLKPMTRGIVTLTHGGYKKIEENSGLQNLAQYGRSYLTKINENDLKSDKTIYELLSICNDIHRKFDKSLTRNQFTDLEVEEYKSYSEVRIDNALNRQKLNHYFSLFAPTKQSLENKSELDSRQILSPT